MKTVVGIVLAGGASRRMGRDKASLMIGGETLARRTANLLAAVCPEVALADRERGLIPGLPSLADGPGRGPAAGLLGAAEVYPGHPLLVLACDLPRVPVPLLALLETTVRAGADLAIPRWQGRLEPLCALYGPRALEILEERVARGVFALHSLAEEEGLAVRYLDEEALAVFGEPGEMFFNVNTVEDLAALTPGPSPGGRGENLSKEEGE
ncbi:MAG TPA: molybdenum cofactor guanylyltransferase [Thermoanaerobaculia bacterium]